MEEFEEKTQVNIEPESGENSSFWDGIIDIVTVVAIGALAVLAAPSYPVLAAGLAVFAVSLAIIEYNDERPGNVFNHPDNILTAAGLGLMTMGVASGSLWLVGSGAIASIISSNEDLYNTLVGENHWLIWLIIAAAIWYMYNNKDKQKVDIFNDKTILIVVAVVLFIFIMT